MTHIPDWLWQGLVEDAAWTGLAFGVAYAWKHRRTIAARLGKAHEDIVIQMQPMTLKVEAQPSLVTIEKTLDARWNVEPPAPSLARRLEDLALWYLRVS
jgi:hypothetical protein